MTDATYINTIEAMSREDFHKKIVREICSRKDFSTVASFGADALSEDEKLNLRTALATNGIPLEVTESDMALTATVYTIAARSVKLQ